MAFEQSQYIDSENSVIESSIEVNQEPAPLQDENLVPEKFRNEDGNLNQDALLKAYKELEQKQGSQGTPEVKPEVTPEVNGTGVSYGSAIDGILSQAGLEPAQLDKEYAESGKLSDATYEALGKAGINKATVDAYTQGIAAQSGVVSAEAGALLTEVYNSVGGEESYTQMSTWAANTFTPAENAAYNMQVNSDNPDVVKLAVGQLKSRFEDMNGTPDPNYVLGGKATLTKDVFTNIQDAAMAMGKARASGSPQAVFEIEQKMLRSNY